jgi:hypothetical protein
MLSVGAVVVLVGLFVGWLMVRRRRRGGAIETPSDGESPSTRETDGTPQHAIANQGGIST